MDHQVLVWVAGGLIALAALALMGLLIRRGGGDSLEVGDMVSGPSPEPPRSPVSFIVLVLLAGTASWAAWGHHGPINLPHFQASAPRGTTAAGPSGSFWDFLRPQHRNSRGGDKAKPAGADAATPAAAGDADTAPDWLRQPTAAQIAAAYPQAARDKPVAASVGLACTADAVGRMVDCRVTSEEPQGQGFGDAALSVAMLYMLAPRPGTTMAGRGAAWVVHFSLPD